jgi:hypothetical protein
MPSTPSVSFQEQASHYSQLLIFFPSGEIQCTPYQLPDASDPMQSIDVSRFSIQSDPRIGFLNELMKSAASTFCLILRDSAGCSREGSLELSSFVPTHALCWLCRCIYMNDSAFIEAWRPERRSIDGLR